MVGFIATISKIPARGLASKRCACITDSKSSSESSKLPPAPSNPSSPKIGRKFRLADAAKLPRVALLAIPIGSTKNLASGGTSWLPLQRFMIVMNFRFSASVRTFSTLRPIQRSTKASSSSSEVQPTSRPSFSKYLTFLSSTVNVSYSIPSSDSSVVISAPSS